MTTKSYSSGKYMWLAPFVILCFFIGLLSSACTSFSPGVCPGPSSRFGEDYGRPYPHTGTDYCVNWGTPVVAVADGWVFSAEYREEDGNTIIIQHEPDLRTIYCHLESMLVSAHHEVKRGEVIALSGNTGRLVGPDAHLHFQVNVGYGWGHPINPYPYYWYGGQGKPLAYDPNTLYAQDRNLFIHPIAYGPYRSEAEAIAREKKKTIKSQ